METLSSRKFEPDSKTNLMFQKVSATILLKANCIAGDIEIKTNLQYMVVDLDIDCRAL